MKLLMVSVDDHAVQVAEAETDTTQLRAAKRALKERLLSLLGEEEISVILEEWPRPEMTIARDIAGDRQPAMSWHNIDMTDDERRAAGIFDEQRNRPGHADWSDMPPSWIRDRVPSDAVREDFFANRIIEASEGSGTAVVLLGIDHVLPVAEKLRAMGHTVCVVP
jgi:hypothetical protein